MFNMDEFLKNAGGGIDLNDLPGVLKAGGVYQPSGGDMHIESALTNMSLAIMQEASGFVARQAFRGLPVQKQYDRYWIYPRGAFNRNQMQKRAPGTRSVGMNYLVDSAPYGCDVYAGHIPVTDQDRDNADSAFNLDGDAVDFLTMKSMLLEEVDWTQKFFGGTGFNAAPGGVWAFVADGGAAGSESAALDFTDAANNNVVQWSEVPQAGELGPIEMVRKAKTTVHQNTGFRPNVMTLGREVYDVLLDHPDIIGRLDAGQTPGGPAMTQRQSLAALFEVEDILVMDAIVNVGKVGLPDDHQFIGGKNALLSYRPASAGLKTPAAGYTILWSGFRGANAGGARIKSWYEDPIEAEIIEIQSAFDHKLVASELGFYFNGIVG